MSKEELRNFKLFALRSHEDDDRKDLQLFDLIRDQGANYQEKKVIRQLYGKKSRPNTYARLRHRLLTEIGKSIALLHWDKEETALVLHELSLAIHYRKVMQYEIALHYLKRAEKDIEKFDFPELLDIVLGEFIGLSCELTSIDPLVYIQRRTENRRRLAQLAQIDNVLAMVNHRLRRSQNLGTGDASVMTILQQTVDEFSVDPKIMADPKIRFRMYDAVSKILLEQRDYEAMEAYLLETYQEFLQQDLFNKHNHDTHLQMLTYIINALFKNGKIEESLAYTERLREGMDQFGQMLQQKYELFYYNSLVLNHSTRDFGEAIHVLKQMLATESIAAIPQYVLFINLNLGLMEYARKNYGAAIKYIGKLKLLESFKEADRGLQLRVDIFELALRLETEDFELLEYRLQQCKSDHAMELASPSMAKDAKMLYLIQRLHQRTPNSDPAILRLEIDAFVQEFPSDDSEMFKYGEFLLGKI